MRRILVGGKGTPPEIMNVALAVDGSIDPELCRLLELMPRVKKVADAGLRGFRRRFVEPKLLCG